MSSVRQTLVSKPDGVKTEFYYTPHKNTVNDCLVFRISFLCVTAYTRKRNISLKESSFVNMAFLIMSEVSSQRFPFRRPRLNLQGKIT